MNNSTQESDDKMGLCSWMFRTCMKLKLKTLALAIGAILFVSFLSIYYITSAASKVQAHHAHRKAFKLGDVLIEDLGAELDSAPNQGIMFRDGKSGRVGTGEGNSKDDLMNVKSPVVHNRNKVAMELLKGIPPEATIFESDELPHDHRLWPTVGNGHLSTAVYSDAVFMNGLYNGHGSKSHRARIPGVISIKITPVGPFENVTLKNSLDVGQGVFTSTMQGSYFDLEQSIYAHRSMPEVLVTEIRMYRYDVAKPLMLVLDVNHGPKSNDINFMIEEPRSQLVDTIYQHGKIKEPEFEGAPQPEVHMFYTEVPKNITIGEAMSEGLWIFMVAMSTNKKKAETAYDDALRFFQIKHLKTKHIKAWSKLWNAGRIDVEGNLDIARQNYAALYYILSSLPLHQTPDFSFVGLSPGSLSYGHNDEDYMGHVFWDQETWMYPSILLLHSNISRILLETRTRTLKAAIEQAKHYGYQGAMFPWESAFTGGDVTPCLNCSRFEQHITGDIALAIQQYLHLTNDTSFLTEGKGEHLILEIAEFWASRVKMDATKKQYVIDGVMPPDEYHFPVNNSVYTNYIAKLSLLLPSYALSLIGKVAPAKYAEIANQIYIPFNNKEGYHPEYDGYIKGTKVKQADAVLLGYPLDMSMRTEVRRNDLLVYESSTDPGGPAMTWGMFAVGWLELKVEDRAERLFSRGMLNAKGPFKIWTENVDGTGAVNFITGMGGYLQSLLNGYIGFRIREKALHCDPILPPKVTKLKITGVNYLRNKLNFEIDRKVIKIILTSLDPHAQLLELVLPDQPEAIPLDLGMSVTVPRRRISISSRSASTAQ